MNKESIRTEIIVKKQKISVLRLFYTQFALTLLLLHHNICHKFTYTS